MAGWGLWDVVDDNPIRNANGWELDRSTVATWLLAAEGSNAKDPNIAQIRDWYDSAVTAHASSSPAARADAEVMMSLLAQRLSTAWRGYGTPSGQVEVARQLVRDVHAALPDFGGAASALGTVAVVVVALLALWAWKGRR